MLPPSKRVVTLSETQPDFANGTPPVKIRTTMKHAGVLYVAGEGPVTPPAGPKLMFITPALEEEEATTSSESVYNVKITEKAQILKGGIGGMIKEAAGLGGMSMDDHYVTAMIKWLLPRDQRNKPSKEAVAWAMPALNDEIREIKPDIIVCFGKPVFDQLVDIKLSLSDALGGWFWSKTYGCRVFLMDKPILLHMKPEKLETFRILFKEVRNMVDRLSGISMHTVETDYRYLRKIGDLEKLIAEIEHLPLASVDCEWGGGNHVDGKLRSIQFCWAAGRAASVKFTDQNRHYCFDASYAEAGEVLGRWMNKPTTKLIAHYASADLPWMSHVLGLDWYDKVAMDTAFALQTVDENAGMGLETLAMTYTDLGRYDLDLMLWRKMNKPAEEDGFATIPDAIIDPYSCQDVDTPMRAYPWLLRRLEAENLTEYFFKLFQPFVTNVFTSFVLQGLPIDIPKMDELRDLFHFAREQLDIRFQKEVADESWTLLLRALIEKGLLPHRGIVSELKAMSPAQRTIEGIEAAKRSMGVQWATVQPWIQHCIEAPAFNIRSKPQMLRWLFDVKGHTPIKSTDNKDKGLRSMAWEKVLELPVDRQKEFTAATDKQTLQILAERDPIVNRLLDLNVVGNLCKAFLKEAEVDEDTGEVTKENGLHYWLSSDNRVHGQMSTTETGRPRAWRPNVLNWPSYVNERISGAIAKVFWAMHEPWREDGWTWDEEDEDPQNFTKNGTTWNKAQLRPFYPSALPERWLKYIIAPEGRKKPEIIPSIRSVVTAITDWCITESDYQTAEIRGLAYLSGDPTLIRFMDEVDPTYGLVLDTKGNKAIVRLVYEHESVSGIPANRQDPQCVMHLWVKGKMVRPVTHEELLRKNGELVHPKYDLHWSLAEMLYELPREKMIAKIHRNAGKVGNFSCIPGSAVITTSCGPLPLSDIKPLHRVWDGVEWVRHEGLQYQGKRQVITYHGLSATPEHVVWGADGNPTTLIDAAWRGLELVVGDPGESLRLHLGSRVSDADAEGDPLERRVSQMRAASLQMGAQFEGGEIAEVQVHAERRLQGHTREHAGCAIPCHGPAVSHGHPRLQPQLQRAGDQGTVQAAGVHPVGAGQVAGGNLPEHGLRPGGQRRTLLFREPSPDFTGQESQKHQGVEGFVAGANPGVYATPSGVQPAAAARVELAPAGEILGRHRGAGDYQPEADQAGTSKEAGREGWGGGEADAGVSDPVRAGWGVGGEAAAAGREPAGDTPREWLADWYAAAGITPPGDADYPDAPGNGLLVGPHCRSVEARVQRSGDRDQKGGPTADASRDGCKVRRSLPRNLQLGHGLSEAQGGDDLGSTGGGGWQEIPVVDVYDLINAGPRKRFTANGVIVSNSAYGASSGTLERKIESETGKKPEPGTGQKLLDALARRQPVATDFLVYLEELPGREGVYVAASGRRRRFTKHPNHVPGISSRTIRGHLSSLGREARNFPFQESVAAAAAKTGNGLLEFGRRFGLRGYPICILYDSAVTHCPLEEREVWKKAHEVFMYWSNGWAYDDRILRYPVDHELNIAWSTPPPDDIAAIWADPEYKPTPEALRPAMQWLETQIFRYRVYPRDSVWNAQDLPSKAA